MKLLEYEAEEVSSTAALFRKKFCYEHLESCICWNSEVNEKKTMLIACVSTTFY